MGNFISKNVSLMLAVAAAYYVYKQIDEKSKVITKPIGQALAEIQFLLNGSNYIKVPNPGFFLNPDKLDTNFKVKDKTWLKAMTMTHDDHQDLIEQIFDGDFVLKPRYQVLIGQAVTAGSIATADKGQ